MGWWVLGRGALRTSKEDNGACLGGAHAVGYGLDAEGGGGQGDVAALLGERGVLLGFRSWRGGHDDMVVVKLLLGRYDTGRGQVGEVLDSRNECTALLDCPSSAQSSRVLGITWMRDLEIWCRITELCSGYSRQRSVKSVVSEAGNKGAKVCEWEI